MSIFRDLWWYFKRERLHYGLGILTLFVVALLELFPPYAVGAIVDAIKQQSLTPGELGKWLLLLGLTAVVLYILRYIWRILLLGRGSAWNACCGNSCTTITRSSRRGFSISAAPGT